MGGYTFVGDEDATPAEEDRGDQAQSFIELIYQTADGWMAVSAHTDATWRGLAAAVERPDWLDDPRFATVALREVNKPERLALTQEALLEDTTRNWMDRLSAHDVPCAPVLTRSEMIRHPQVSANGILIESEHPQAGRLRQARTPARFSATPIDAPRPARPLGADTRDVLAEAGYSKAEIAELITVGAATDQQEATE
jgi:crotonobetainyl-CoA:carnitine CoA-transferase CaiB-like acyl-CoA transferase